MKYNVEERISEIRESIAYDNTVCKHCGKRLLRKDAKNYKNTCKYHEFNLAIEINTRNAEIDNQ